MNGVLVQPTTESLIYLTGLYVGSAPDSGARPQPVGGERDLMACACSVMPIVALRTLTPCCHGSGGRLKLSFPPDATRADPSSIGRLLASFQDGSPMTNVSERMVRYHSTAVLLGVFGRRVVLSKKVSVKEA